MTGRRRIEERISKKELEIQELEMKIREARAYVQALQDVAKMLPRETDESKVSEETESSIREGSYVGDARKAIEDAGHPLHVVEILKRTGRENNRKNRTGMSGSLAAYVRRGEAFTRPKPNTFGLISYSNPRSPQSSQPSAQPSNVPPDNFGMDTDE